MIVSVVGLRSSAVLSFDNCNSLDRSHPNDDGIGDHCDRKTGS